MDIEVPEAYDLIAPIKAAIEDGVRRVIEEVADQFSETGDVRVFYFDRGTPPYDGTNALISVWERRTNGSWGNRAHVQIIVNDNA